MMAEELVRLGANVAVHGTRQDSPKTCGEGESIPMRVSYDTLEEHKRPASEATSFAALWNDGGGEEESVGRTVARWRSQGR